MRERLIELLRQAEFDYYEECAFSAECDKCAPDQAKFFADILLANGVIVPPCKVGDTVYWAFHDTSEEVSEVFEGFIRGLSIGQNGTTWFSVVYDNGLTYAHTFKDYWGQTVFLTREEAEQALEKMKGGAVQ